MTVVESSTIGAPPNIENVDSSMFGPKPSEAAEPRGSRREWGCCFNTSELELLRPFASDNTVISNV